MIYRIPLSSNTACICFVFQREPELEFNAVYEAKIVEIR